TSQIRRWVPRMRSSGTAASVFSITCLRSSLRDFSARPVYVWPTTASASSMCPSLAHATPAAVTAPRTPAIRRNVRRSGGSSTSAAWTSSVHMVLDATASAAGAQAGEAAATPLVLVTAEVPDDATSDDERRGDQTPDEPVDPAVGVHDATI